ncbi:hypothetical protein B0E47_05135 [Rhodanobacter sp. B05]|nr:hypothetical protein B0E47_05135 [Rhodanobacter sp. B05]
MPFPTNIRQEAIVRSHRRCCVCHEFGGRSVSVHHIVQEADGGPNTLENAICLCLRCHAEAGHFNPRHPLGTKYSPAELAAHRDQWWAHCASHPHEPIGLALDISYKSVLRNSDVHRYRLLVSYTNSTSTAQDGWKVQIYIPSFVPYVQCEFDAYEDEALEGDRYTEFETQSHERVFPGETVKIAGSDPFPYPSIEYEITSLVYHSALRSGDVRWRFYTANAPVIEGSRRLSELHEF